MPANDSNFLMWFRPGEDQFTQPIPRPFVREPEMFSPAVWVIPGDAIYFYYNSLDNTRMPGDKIQIQYNTQPPVDLAVSEIDHIQFPDGEHSYGRVVMLLNPIMGMCRLVCGNLTSQWIWMASEEEAAIHTTIVKFSNPRRLQNIRYGYLPEGFQQTFRLRLSGKTAEPEHNKEIYTESATGKDRAYYSEPKWVYGLQTPDYDLWAHRAAASMLEHDDLIINEQPYSYKSAYKANMTADSAYSTGEFEVHDERYSTLSRA